jgi:hypothetical protein
VIDMGISLTKRCIKSDRYGYISQKEKCKKGEIRIYTSPREM